ncbi:LemA family protein [Ignatzschineria sp. LJL83]
MKPSKNWAFIPLAIIVIIFGFVTMGYYNSIQTLDEHQEAAAAEVINQYQRRADLITNLANSVKGYAKHEQSIFTEIATSRAQLNAMHVNPQDFKDPAKLEAFEKAQTTLNSQLSRLLVVVENYPDLKASSLYQNLMVQLEGTENRISVARKRYIEAIREYNTLIRKVPYIFIAKVFSYEPLEQFSVEDPSIYRAPELSF